MEAGLAPVSNPYSPTHTLYPSQQIMEHLVQRWRIADLTGLNSKGEEAQEFVCNLPARIRRLAERKAGELVWCGGWVLVARRCWAK